MLSQHPLNTAVADEKYFYHYIFPPETPRFALFYALFLDFFKSYSFPKTVAKVAKYGSLRPSVVVFCSQLVVDLGGADYWDF